MTTTASVASDYAIRRYEGGDWDEFVALYERVFGERAKAWFDWKFAENPYADDVPIFVVEHDGDLVGARPSLHLPLQVGGTRVPAIMQVDPMVHPDHRGQGLFTRMVEHVYDHYADREQAISIGFPNEAVKGALLKLGEKLSLAEGVVDTVPKYYRVQNPEAFVEAEGSPSRALGRLATPAVRGYLSVRDRLAPAAEGLSVERHDGVPADTLAALARKGNRGVVHAVRDEEFYRWRFANPRYEYTTYVASRDGTPVASIVAGRRLEDGTRITHLSDVLPVTGPNRDAHLSRLLATLVDDHADADVVAAAGPVVPERVLSAYGFAPNTSFPLSRVTTTDYFIARPLTAERMTSWRLGGCWLSEPTNWRLSFCERELG